MPARLWDEASLLARELGVHRIKSALRLNYESLRRRVGQSGAKRPGAERPGAERGTAATKAHFVELSGAQLLEPERGLVVEVSVADGSRLTIRLATGSELDVAGVVEAFRRRA